MKDFSEWAQELAEETYLEQIGAIEKALREAFAAGERQMRDVCEGVCWTYAEECEGQTIKASVAEELAHRIAGEPS